MKFSQRIGITPVRTLLQTDNIDEPLKNRLWNLILVDFINNLRLYDVDSSNEFYAVLWIEFFKKPIDTIPQHFHNDSFFKNGRIDNNATLSFLRAWYFKCEWHEIYDLVEFISKADKLFNKTFNFDNNCNNALKKELSGFRVIEGKVIPIASDEELQEIESAIGDTNGWNSVNTHLSTAIKFLADRKEPNYRNSIKESISAVESLCIIITGNSKATLGQALNEIEKKHSFHNALKSSFSSLYGYTSDSSGIRHSLTENDVAIDFEEAKFMLVSCSAFVNYLKSKYISPAKRSIV